MQQSTLQKLRQSLSILHVRLSAGHFLGFVGDHHQQGFAGGAELFYALIDRQPVHPSLWDRIELESVSKILKPTYWIPF